MKSNGSGEKKTAAEILIERFLEDCDAEKGMPWQRPYKCFNAFNYMTLQPYHGFNRIFLPFGEYLTYNQMRELSRRTGLTYKHKDTENGASWYPISYYQTIKDVITVEQAKKELNLDEIDLSEDMSIGVTRYYRYWVIGGRIIREHNVLKYYRVTNIKDWVDSNGNPIPSRIDMGEVELTYSDASSVINQYVEREGITLDTEYRGIPCYIPALDQVCLNPFQKSQDSWYSTAFHELGHSTGHANRLNRPGVTGGNASKDAKAVEECIAEICAGLCCSECNVYGFSTSCSQEYKNNLAYVNSWKAKIKDWGNSFFYVCTQAEKAFNYIMGGEV